MDFDPRVVEMMHARIDGVISEREKSELLEFLAGNPEAREYFDDLERISQMLDGAERVTPPTALRDRVMAAITPSVSLRSRTTSGGGSMILRYAYAAAAGLVLGVLAYHFISSSDFGRTVVEPAEAAGAMTALPEQAERTLIETIELDLPDGRGTVYLEKVQGGASVLLDLDSPSTVEVALEFDAGQIGFCGFTRELGGGGSLEVEEGTVTWTQQGHNRVALTVELHGGSPAKIDLRLLADGEPLINIQLNLPLGTDSDVDS
jgi:hypothetical protein